MPHDEGGLLPASMFQRGRPDIDIIIRRTLVYGGASAVVSETVQPAHVSLWLRSGAKGTSSRGTDSATSLRDV